MPDDLERSCFRTILAFYGGESASAHRPPRAQLRAAGARGPPTARARAARARGRTGPCALRRPAAARPATRARKLVAALGRHEGARDDLRRPLRARDCPQQRTALAPAPMYTYTCMHIHTYVHVYHMCTYIHTCTYTCTYTCKIHIHTHTHGPAPARSAASRRGGRAAGGESGARAAGSESAAIKSN